VLLKLDKLVEWLYNKGFR